MTMTFDEQWMQMWHQYMEFLRINKRRPSKYYPEERYLVNWVKYNRKQRNKNKLLPGREEKFAQLLEQAKKYQRINSSTYAYLDETPPVVVRPLLFDTNYIQGTTEVLPDETDD